ncbi:hypothetical protein HK101_006882, partial [Irineochytrium annulatum]
PSTDWLDRLGIDKDSLPAGRAPSTTGFVGGFPVARSHNQVQMQRQQQKVAAMAAGVPLATMRDDDEVDFLETMGGDGLFEDGLEAGGGHHGNFALSSCPGKKVRLDSGPVNGRAMINRDLNHDFQRLAALQIRLVICCLNDAELSYLGAPWAKYRDAATKNGMDVIRIPIIEGSCPDSVEEVERVLEEIELRIKDGLNVLCHCRGGIGRAGLIACCFLIRRGYVYSAARAIQYVRVRRSPKAIETQRQEDFIMAYFTWAKQRRIEREKKRKEALADAM